MKVVPTDEELPQFILNGDDIDRNPSELIGLPSESSYVAKVEQSEDGSEMQRVNDDQSTGTMMKPISETSSVINRVQDDQSTGTYMGHAAMSDASSVMMRIDNGTMSSAQSSVI